MNRFKVSCIQTENGNDWKLNLDRNLTFASKALASKPDLIVFPENFLWRGPSEKLNQVAVQGSASALSIFQAFAKRFKTFLLLGSLVLPSAQRNKYANVSILINAAGHIQATYQKIHLFDVCLPKVKVQESKHFIPGSKPVTASVKSVCLGFSICYDLRFPELFRTLAKNGAKVIFVPANFTYPTGKAHWEILLRARAIENQVYIVACGQVGKHPDSGIQSFGHSMVIDPWGKVLAELGDTEEGVLNVGLDLKLQASLRKEFPVLSHIVL